MNRQPLYFDVVEGGLVPVTSPDKLDPSIMPTLFDQRDSFQSNRNYFVLDSPAHRVIPITHSSVAGIMTGLSDSSELIYRVLAFTGEVYYFAEIADFNSIVGLCLGIAAFGDDEYVVIQLTGLIKPIISSGYDEAFEFPSTYPNYYLSAEGSLSASVSSVQITNQQSISVKMSAIAKQAIISGGIISSAGLVVSAQAGTTVTIGDGVETHTYSYPTQTVIASVPPSSTSHLYLLPNGSVEVSSKAYIVVPTETTFELEKLLGVVTTGSKSSNVVVSGSTIKSTATSSWGSCYFSNDLMTNYQYYQFTHGSGISSSFVGVGAVNTGTVMANSGLNISSGVTQVFYLSLQSTISSFTKHGSATLWTVHDSSTITNSGTKVHRVLVDQIRKRVYWSIDGVWLNSGQPIASYAGTDKIVPMFSVANNTVFLTFNTPTVVTLPSGFVESYNYYDKSNNVSYSYPTLSTIDYSPKMYLGKVVSNSTTVTSITSPPLNNTYTEEVYVSELTGISHNLFAHNPTVTMNQERDLTYTIASYPQIVYISTNAMPQFNTTVTVTL